MRPDAGIPFEDFRPPDEGTAVALGFFDGVHRGHQGILRLAWELAREGGLEPVAFTFSNHPSTVVAPDRVPGLLTTSDERMRLLESMGLKAVWLEFLPEFSRTSPEAFLRETVRDHMGARAVSVGPNYRFGHHAKGDPALLEALGPGLGMTVRVAPALESEGALISSSRIRELVRHGRMEEAAAAMGRPYRLEGPVESGSRRGAGLGTRTANLRMPPGKVVPPTGVYAVWAGPAGDLRPGVANLGTRPTFGGGELLLEVHLFDFEGDLYGRRLECFLASRLRSERQFPGAEALVAQIARDAAEALALLERMPRPGSLSPAP